MKLFLKTSILFYVISIIINYIFDDEIYFVKNLVTAVLFGLCYSLIYTKLVKKNKMK